MPPIAPAATAAIGTDDLLDGLVDEAGVADNDELEKAEVVEKPAVVWEDSLDPNVAAREVTWGVEVVLSVALTNVSIVELAAVEPTVEPPAPLPVVTIWREMSAAIPEYEVSILVAQLVDPHPHCL
jgi:hypothetical protein